MLKKKKRSNMPRQSKTDNIDKLKLKKMCCTWDLSRPNKLSETELDMSSDGAALVSLLALAPLQGGGGRCLTEGPSDV